MLDGNAARYLLELIGNWQNQGLPRAEASCNYLETANHTQPAPPNGIFATESTSDAVKNYVATIVAYNSVSDGKSPHFSPLTVKTLKVAEPAENVTDETQSSSHSTLAWQYQYCSQFGFYITANPNNSRSIVAQAISLSYYQTGCDTSFPNGAIPSTPAVDQVNKFGGWNMNPSRVMFTNSEVDPWRSLGVASEEFNSPQRKPNQTIPAANGHFDTKTYFGLVYPKQVHAPDMHIDSSDGPGEIAAFEQGLALFSSALDVWLPSFNTSRDTQSNSTSPKPGDDSHNDTNEALALRAPYYAIQFCAVLAFLISLV